MARSRGKKSFCNDSLVIVCEGTETEAPYFMELCKLNDNWRVVPEESEVVTKEAKHKRNAVCRTLRDGDLSVYSGPEYYVGLPEVDNSTYQEYRKEPLRWVRAAHLFQERFGFFEAWAVFDLDQGRENGLIDARNYILDKENLHIAFSAYSIEEWFLLHFERNPKAFEKSECRDAHHNKVNCGHDECVSSLNCHGDECLGGRLREGKFIPSYTKKDGSKLVAITKDRRHIAYVNAAWSRSLSTEEVYKRNPYTDVDRLIMRLLNDDYDICWIKRGATFHISGDSHVIEIVDGELKLLYVGKKAASILVGIHIYWCDNKYEPIANALSGEKCILDNNNNHSLRLINKPSDITILCIKDGNRKEYYCEI